MAKNVLIDGEFEHYKSVIDEIFRELHQLTLTVGDDKLSDTVDNIRSKLNEPFLFVIVGEVKVGKSSFVNALLQTERDICKVAADPCTDTIQQIVYGNTETILPINEYLKKITVPVDILKKIAIVDTPGTNTIIEHHIEVTEKFIPVSDLIVFVFEAKNPYRKSAWEFFDYISKEWRKKVVFVLQQADLMEPEDLVVNKEGVIRYAKDRGISDPIVFTVSAKLEKKGDTENSGFADVRDFIKETVTGGNNVQMKVRSLMQTSKNIFQTIDKGINARNLALKGDVDFRHRVDNLLDNAEGKSQTQIDGLIDGLILEYDKITGAIQQEFEDGLGFFRLLKKSIMSIFDSNESLKEWIQMIAEKLESQLKPALENKMREGVINIADSIRQMAEIIDGEIQKRKSGIKSNHQVFGAIADKRQEKLERLQENIGEFIDETGAFVNNNMLAQSADLIPNMATGGGLMVIGGILAAVVHGAVFDITGGILVSLGLLVGGVFTSMKRNKIVAEFESEIDKGREKLKEQIQNKLENYVKEIRTKIDNNFLEFDSFLNEEKNNLNTLVEKYEGINGKFDKLANDLGI
jgi:small GTP-binding protein